MSDKKDWADLLKPFPMDKAPTAEAPQNVKELLEQRQDLHGGRGALHRVNKIFKQFAPTARSRVVDMLEKQGEGESALPRLFRFLRDTIDGPKTILTEAEERDLVDLYRRVKGAVAQVDGKIIHAITPDNALQLAADAHMLMGRLIEKYDYDKIKEEVEFISELTATATMDAMTWWIENGYRMSKANWVRNGKPFLAGSHAGASPVKGTLGEEGRVELWPKKKAGT